MDRYEHMMMGRVLDGEKGKLADFQDAQIANYLEYYSPDVGSKDILQPGKEEERGGRE